METADSWRKSSYSGANGGECVEVAATAGTVMVRDTRDRDGNVLRVPPSAWRAFVCALK